jgi:hypothetical protein
MKKKLTSKQRRQLIKAKSDLKFAKRFTTKSKNLLKNWERKVKMAEKRVKKYS